MSAIARMSGRDAPAWCPICHAPPGPDCPSTQRSGRQVRQRLKAELRRETAAHIPATERRPA